MKPAADLDAREELTAFLAVRGSMHVHDWVDPTASDEDAYSLFTRRSVAMGWSDSAMSSTSGGRTWTVVDAGQDWSAGASKRLGWWQVTVPVPAATSVPVQALMACAQACLDRIGTADVTVMELLAPITAAPSRVGHVVAASAWFALAPPTARAGFELCLDVGAGSASVAPQALLEAVQRLHTGPFVFARVRESDLEGDLDAPADELWFTPAPSRTVVSGSCPEWGLDAAGWLAALVLEVAREIGVTGMVRLQVRRAPDEPPQR